MRDARALVAPKGPLARDEIELDEAALQAAACDCFHECAPPRAICTPGSVAALARALPALAGAGFAIVPRGAALSYSGGTTPGSPEWIAIDVAHLDRVLEIRADDAWVHVQAGCTWAELAAALAPHGLVTPFRGPASGLHATIGGTISNDAIFYGSGVHGTAASSVLGLAVVLADGRVLRTGVCATGTAPSAIAFGPDLTRAFIGACGAFGIVVEAVLRVIPAPIAQRYLGFRCPDARVAAAALAALGRLGVASEALVLDPSVATLLAGAEATESLGPGRRAAAGAPHLLSVAIDAATAAGAADAETRARGACLAAGATADGEGLLRPWREHPFQPPAMLRDAQGRRWVPVHGVVPQSRVDAAVRALEGAIAAHAERIAALGLTWHCTWALVGPGAVLIEANLHWRGGSNAAIDRYLGAAETAVGGTAVAGVHAADSDLAAVVALRAALAAALASAGATHLQIGRFYRYLDRLDAPARDALVALKRVLDPRGSMNPGVLGLGPDSLA